MVFTSMSSENPMEILMLLSKIRTLGKLIVFFPPKQLQHATSFAHMLSYVRFEDKTVSYRAPGFLSCLLIVASTSQDRIQEKLETWRRGFFF